MSRDPGICTPSEHTISVGGGLSLQESSPLRAEALMGTGWIYSTCGTKCQVTGLELTRAALHVWIPSSESWNV